MTEFISWPLVNRWFVHLGNDLFFLFFLSPLLIHHRFVHQNWPTTMRNSLKWCFRHKLGNPSWGWMLHHYYLMKNSLQWIERKNPEKIMLLQFSSWFDFSFFFFYYFFLFFIFWHLLPLSSLSSFYCFSHCHPFSLS